MDMSVTSPPKTPDAKTAPLNPPNTKPPDIASASVPDTLVALRVNPDTGLTSTEADVRRKEHGYNEVAEQKGHPLLMFLGKFWGLSAWMLELIMVVSAALGHFPDLALVGVLLVINAVVGFTQERRAAGVVAISPRSLSGGMLRIPNQKSAARPPFINSPARSLC